MRKFTVGERVYNRYGELLTVDRQRGCQVWVCEDVTGWYHPTNLFKLKKCVWDKCKDCGTFLKIEKLQKGTKKITNNYCKKCWGKYDPALTEGR